MKKAKIELNEKTYIIEITEDIDYRYRIIEELATMALEKNPMLHPREELKNIPFINWNPEDFENEEHTKIQEVIEKKEEEFYEVFSKLLIEKLNLTIKKDEFLYLGDSYNITEQEKEQNITIHYEISIEKKYIPRNIKEIIKENKKQINALVNKYKKVRDAEIDLAFIGNENDEIIGIQIYIMLKLDEDNFEGINYMNIGYVPQDEDERYDLTVLERTTSFKEFSVKYLLEEIDYLNKESVEK